VQESQCHATGGRCPRFAHESDKISKAVYQALPLRIVAALQGYAEAYATIIAYGTPTSGYWRKSALVATTACSLSQIHKMAKQIAPTTRLAVMAAPA
jgi:hypothetical protein